MKRFYLTEASVEILAEIARAYRAGKLGAQAAPSPTRERRRRDMPYTPAAYRLATNDGDGAYTLRKQVWDADADAEEMIDIPDEYDPDYKLDIKGYDYRGRVDGVAGAAGTGQIVRGWRIWHVDDWITLVDVRGQATEWARPSSASNTGSVSTIDVIVTDEEGVDLVPEEAITVYIMNDQSEVVITPREWDQSTILSFVRSKKDTANVSGVLVGEGQHEPPNDRDTLYQQPWSTCASLAMVDGDGHPIGWYHYQYPNWEWYSPWGYAAPAWTPPF